ncbi:RidA family protein [Larkinella arboricola]|uniref:Enamine deaminase RidA (YjgF/YER057c/UK114 family) n=1 Tax=Larkinella arboricola TaxID=643671 RepID=A0A327XCC1_LARAB|nr:RidA family protein [Larkinella arboricola]RAK03272.1 enamine deaminase RidA (YjgF/YER057c/UK114 family) [Larkinella arboricola]
MSKIQRVNPDGMMSSPAFAQAIITEGSGKTIYIGGQNAVNQKNELIGKGDLAAQTEQVLTNIQTALEACGATFDHVVKMTIYLVQGQDPRIGFGAAQKFITAPPTISVVMVAGLGNPDFLLEMDAVAFV